MSTSYRRAACIAAATLLLAATGVPLSAQQHDHATDSGAPVVVSGRVVCEEGYPLPQAVVQVYHAGADGRHLRAGVLTDENGRFAFRVPSGAYTVGVSFIGHAPYETAMRIESAAPVGLGDVRLALQALELDALTVTATAEPVRLRSGSIVVDARETATAGGTVADVLRTVPGIEIDGEGRITLRGSASVLVLIDGRPSPLEGAALSAFLSQMPASALERIEAGTTAGAAQDAEGSAGVVNLVFAESAAQATDLRSLAASIASDDHYLASGAATGRLGRALSWDASYSFSSLRPRTESSTLRVSLVPDDSIGSSEQDSDARARHRLNSLTAGLGVRVTDALTLSARATGALMEGLFRNRTRFEDTPRDGAAVARETQSLLEHVIPSANGAVTLAWSPSEGPRLRTELQGAMTDEDFQGDYADDAGVRFLERDMDSRHREYAVRNDLSFGIGETALEIGQATRLRTLDARYGMASNDDAEIGDFRYENRIHAAYASALGTIGGVRVEAGMRVENDRVQVEHDDVVASEAWRAFPSLRLDWTPDELGGIRYRLAYGRRIDRPDFSALNPYAMGEDDMNSVVGNPALAPELVDQLELGFERHGAASIVQVTPFVRWTRDPIRPLKAVTESGQSTTTLHNLSHATAAGLDASVRMDLGDRVVATLSGSAAHVETAGLRYGSSGLSVTTRALVEVGLTERTTLQAYAHRRGTQAIEQGEILPGTTTELALTHRWGADARGRLTLRLSDPFRTSDLEYRVDDIDFTQESRRQTHRPLLSLFASWAVGGDPIESTRAEEESPTLF